MNHPISINLANPTPLLLRIQDVKRLPLLWSSRGLDPGDVLDLGPGDLEPVWWKALVDQTLARSRNPKEWLHYFLLETARARAR